MSDWRMVLGVIGVVWIGYVFVGYPFLLALVARFKRIRPQAREDFFPSVSVLISARNEEKDIEWKVRETLAWDYPADKLDVWVLSDASDDRTDEILKKIDDPRFHWVRTDRRGGKNRALNRLAQMAKGEVFFFSDANSHIEAGCLRRVIRHFADARVGCVTGNSNTAVAEEAASSGTAFYWGHEMLIRHLENQFGSVLVCDGAIFAIRGSLYQPCIPELANDLELPLRIARAGYWILHESRAQVKEKDTGSPLEELSRRQRICAQGALGMRLLRSTLRGVRAWQFFSHKCLRWLLAVPFTLVLIASGLLAKSYPWMAIVFGLQVLVWGLGLIGLALDSLGKQLPRPLAAPAFLLVSCVGAFLGVIHSLTGRRFDVWESPSLTRGERPV